MASKKKSVSGKKSPKAIQKIRENKTFMLPKQPEEVPELPELEMNFPEEKKEGLLKGLFKFGKKAQPEESKELDSDVEFAKPLEIPEPEFLKEVDLGHSGKVEPELALWLKDGMVVKNLEELTKALKTMKSRIFNHHLEERDIVHWVRDIIGNRQLAAELALAKTKKDAVKILENSRKGSEKKAKKEEREPVAKRDEQLEIQKAIEDVSLKTREKAAEDTPLEEREKELEEKERLLELEEEHINKKRIELANKHYKLIKERGGIEKEKFEKMLKSHGTPEEPIAHDYAGMPNLELTADYSKDKIRSLLEETRKAISQGQTEEAKRLVEELKRALEFTEIPARESKKLEYDVLELEADLKLATLV